MDQQDMPEEMRKAMSQIQALLTEFAGNGDAIPTKQVVAKVNMIVDRMGFDLVRSGKVPGNDDTW